MMPAVYRETSSLLLAIQSAEVDAEEDFAVISDPPTRPSIGLQVRIYDWLKSVGLKVNPFDADLFDAGRDPFIPFYLIDHNQYKAINGDFVSFIFAAPGSGKSAFRVRLTRDCRVGKDRRKIFPIVYNLPLPNDIPIPPDVH